MEVHIGEKFTLRIGRTGEWVPPGFREPLVEFTHWQRQDDE